MDFAGAARTAADLIRGPFMATWLIEMKLIDESHFEHCSHFQWNSLDKIVFCKNVTYGTIVWFFKQILSFIYVEMNYVKDEVGISTDDKAIA